MLTLALILLKVCGLLNWSWAAVTAPAWLMFVLVTPEILCTALAAGIDWLSRSHACK